MPRLVGVSSSRSFFAWSRCDGVLGPSSVARSAIEMICTVEATGNPSIMAMAEARARSKHVTEPSDLANERSAAR